VQDSPALYSHNRNNNSHHPSREISVLIRISYEHAVTSIFTADFMHTRQKTTISPVHRWRVLFPLSSVYAFFRAESVHLCDFQRKKREGREKDYRFIVRISKVRSNYNVTCSRLVCARVTFKERNQRSHPAISLSLL